MVPFYANKKQKNILQNKQGEMSLPRSL